ncbi:bifunctional DNA primase/polymerase [Lentzea aerocolonigenes]|uniref:bifunctional DNA primase/polymerase n=1 Tax=Lentzea aerocolonigenes TaxID=68170 RepID=UPI00068C7243|nr:bifunctional DNA primase/polymerase [Lentzea aerocolonigenes]MCP2247723.1 Bifunctional DNA primase/polymerase, N-terminal [Lentzea aerocolonigenes]
MSEQNTLLTHALSAAEMGFYVFPLRPRTKRPALHSAERCPRTEACRNGHLGWEQRATTDPKVIERCWSAGPFNIGIATGPSGLVVIDLDTRKSPDDVPPPRWSREGIRDGHDVFAAVCAEAREDVPWETRTVRTARGGTHLYFREPSTVELRNTEGEHGNGLGWKVDTRAHGGYVVGPGSITPDGEYSLTEDRSPLDLPVWLVYCLTPRPRTAVSAPVVVPSQCLPRYVTAAVDGECRKLSTAVSGGHDRAAFVAGIALGQLVGAGVLPPATAEAHLMAAATPLINGECDCTEGKVRRSIRNGITEGTARPRQMPGTERPAQTATPMFDVRGAA